MSDPAAFAPHLQPGERIVWAGEESRALIKSAHDFTRMSRLAWGVIGIGLTAFIGYRFIETMADYAHQPNMSAGLGAPLYLIFALTFAAVAIFSLLRLAQRPREPERYAVTDQRILALDPQGRLTQQMARDRVGEIKTNGQHLIVMAIGRDEDEPGFALANLADPAAAHAALDPTLLEPAP